MSNQSLVNHLIAIGALKTKSIISAFLKVDRNDFVLQKDRNQDYVYDDYPLSIGFGQTISQPYTVAFMLELLTPKAGDIVLDVGSGSGWTTALLTQIVGKKGRVLGVERIPQLVEFGRDNLASYNFTNVDLAPVLKLKLRKDQFDKILVSASAQKLPQKYVNALIPNGTLVIPIQNSIWQITKSKSKSGKITSYEYPGFVFVPLID